MAKLVSKTYGDALFETAVESNRLDDFSEEIDIKGNHNIMECELHPALHKTILDRAIQLAITSKAVSEGVKQQQ